MKNLFCFDNLSKWKKVSQKRNICITTFILILFWYELNFYIRSWVFFSIIQILSQWKNRKKKKLDFNHRSIIYFLKFGGSSNYCVFFHTFRKVRILFIISTAAAKNLVFFFMKCCWLLQKLLRFVFISRYQFFFKVQIKFSFFL